MLITIDHLLEIRRCVFTDDATTQRISRGFRNYAHVDAPELTQKIVNRATTSAQKEFDRRQCRSVSPSLGVTQKKKSSS
ncbi:MAG: hypothetical protein COT25_01325 [Candidatus Kerfeldbacteria bacterium CG08_land_8_20_14_0_20_42_7]|uniref:Uncharacterized protein n=1 Tax=Candidatus Kerfeldbacteria bacterium CG08_land_8_20_14_0_20_42_7 TaxID=2014245 RepID=A0A2H0YTE2_9BACT|nr:MAG: hypothetical protein COT25_01325 [Candidatus Kerfeldbacteria bacterium CG08_land_8_20_14_0_20_42_7]